MRVLIRRRPPGTDEQPVRLRVRLHIEKIDQSGDAPVLTDYLIVDDEGRVEHPPREE